MNRPVCVANLGRRPYPEVWDLQKRLVEQIADEALADQLLLVEHDPVITLGRKSGARADVCEAGKDIPTFEVERGGEATYHALGQLVAYPLVRLEGADRDLHRFLRLLEEVQILTLARWNIEGTRQQGLTGVWVGNRKIASIGIAVRRWVTYHGIGLNVNTDLAGFGAIRPCGLASEVMTSMEALVGTAIAMDEVQAEFVMQFGRVFARPVLPGQEFPRVCRDRA